MARLADRSVYSEKGGEFKVIRDDGRWKVVWFARVLQRDHDLCDADSEPAAMAIADAMNRQRSA